MLAEDGDLELHRRALTGRTTARITLVDRTDPRIPVDEGPGPNVIEDVAGIIDGALIVGDCCEPISGTVAIVTQPGGAEIPVLAGYAPNLSPNGSRLATVNDVAIVVADLDEGTARSLTINQDPSTPYQNVRDVEWLTDTTFAVLSWTDPSGYAVTTYDAAPVDAGSTANPPARRSPGSGGHRPVRPLRRSRTGRRARRRRRRTGPPHGSASSTRPHWTSAVELERTLPADVRSVELADDGLGLLWVDDAVVFHLPAGSTDATAVASGARTAWFVTGPRLPASG